jgi:ribonuclease P protein component
MRGFSRLQGRYFSLSFGTLPGRSPAGACVVSKKAAPKAHDRNRIKRRCRSILAKLMPGERLVFVVYAKKGAAAASFSDTEADIRSLVARATKRDR